LAVRYVRCTEIVQGDGCITFPLPVSVSRLPSVFFDNRCRILVITQSGKLRMTQVAAFGPFQEFNLGYQFGIDPNTLLHFLRRQSFAPSRLSRFRQVDEGTFNPRQRPQFLKHLANVFSYGILRGNSEGIVLLDVVLVNMLATVDSSAQKDGLLGCQKFH